MLIKAFDGQMYFCVEEKVYALDIIPEHARISKNFDISPVREPALPGGALFMPRKVFTENEPFKETLFLISFIKKHHKTGAYVLVLLGHFQKCLTEGKSCSSPTLLKRCVEIAMQFLPLF
jgi:hypothetical protein